MQLDETHNPWLAKYLEFVEKLTAHSQGRYPVGQPILRGTSDMLGALRGQTNLVFDYIDHPDAIQQLAQKDHAYFSPGGSKASRGNNRIPGRVCHGLLSSLVSWPLSLVSG